MSQLLLTKVNVIFITFCSILFTLLVNIFCFIPVSNLIPDLLFPYNLKFKNKTKKTCKILQPQLLFLSNSPAFYSGASVRTRYVLIVIFLRSKCQFDKTFFSSLTLKKSILKCFYPAGLFQGSEPKTT